MAAKPAAQPPEWITPGEGLGALIRAGRPPQEAAVLLFRNIRLGGVLGRASRIRMEFTDGVSEWMDHPVPAFVWQTCPLPPFGHGFWTEGDIQVCPNPVKDETVLTIGSIQVDCPLGAILPVTTVTGFRIPSYAVIALGGVFDQPSGRGRRQGVGGFAIADAPLIEEMRRLLVDGLVSSVHAAAVQVAPEAAGAGEPEAKVRRLTERYKAAFPDSP